MDNVKHLLQRHDDDDDDDGDDDATHPYKSNHNDGLLSNKSWKELNETWAATAVFAVAWASGVAMACQWRFGFCYSSSMIFSADEISQIFTHSFILL